nr:MULTISPECIES: CcdB family protein [unclassified Mesorhizobium]
MVPHLPVSVAPPAMRKLHPIFEINGRKLVKATHLLATVSTTELGESRLNLMRYHDEIAAALDMPFQGVLSGEGLKPPLRVNQTSSPARPSAPRRTPSRRGCPFPW